MKIKSRKKRIFLTLDFEEDGGTASLRKEYFCHFRSKDFVDFVKKNELKVTLFVTGHILQEFPQLLNPYLVEQDLFQFELHSFDHSATFLSFDEQISNINKGIKSYQDFFGKLPTIYRAPNGMINIKILKYLESRGIHFSSSFFPSYFPGRFNNLHVPQYPFKIKEIEMVEIPFSVTRNLSIPLGLSYIQLLGLSVFKTLLGMNRDNVIFDFHLHDIFTKEWIESKNLKTIHKFAYFGAYRINKGLAFFQKVIEYYKKNKYEFCLLNEYIDKLESEVLNEFDSKKL